MTSRPATAACLFLALSAGCPGLLAPHDRESEARQAVEGLRGGTGFQVGGRRVALTHLELSEIEVDGSDPPRALFHLVATGTFGNAQLGYYGSERVTFERKQGRLTPPEVWLPKLRGVLEALVARDAALAAGDPQGLARLAAPEDGGSLRPAISASSDRLAPDAADGLLSIRVDGDRAQVSSVSSMGARLARRSASLGLFGDSWRFTSGLL